MSHLHVLKFLLLLVACRIRRVLLVYAGDLFHELVPILLLVLVSVPACLTAESEGIAGFGVIPRCTNMGMQALRQHRQQLANAP